MTPENVARAAVEGMLCGLADGRDALRALGIKTRRVLLVGGASRSAAVRAAAPTIFQAPVTVPDPGEYVALGAARQAAWALAGTPAAPQWPQHTAAVIDNVDEEAGTEIRTRYTETRRTLYPDPHLPAPAR